MNRKKFIQSLPIFVLAGSVLARAKIPEVQEPGLSPQQLHTKQQIIKEITKKKYKEVQFITKKDFNDIVRDISSINDSILVGRNVVFDPKWLEYIGAEKAVSRAHFANAIENIDLYYDLHKSLTGSPPRVGEKIYIYLKPHHPNNERFGAYACADRNLCVMNGIRSENIKKQLRTINSIYGWGKVVMHEMAHLFSNGQPWCAMPHISTKFMELHVYDNVTDGKAKSKAVKRKLHGEALAGFKNGGLDVINNNYTATSVTDFYLLGLLDKVGYEPLKKAIHSYNDKNFKPTHKYTSPQTRGRMPEAIALELIERVAHFSGVPNILQSLPDRGALLKRFNVTKTQIRK